MPSAPDQPTGTEPQTQQLRADGLPGAAGMYHPDQEKAACGVGMVVAIDGKPRRQVITTGIEALRSLWHRGAIDADGKTGDGAGIHLQLSEAFFRRHIQQSGGGKYQGRLAVGQVFLPRTDLAAQERCRQIVEREILRESWKILGWRQVPIDISAIGEKAIATRPEIEQIIIAPPENSATCSATDETTTCARLESNLFLIRRRIEKAVNQSFISGFYICSLSCQSIIYKGLFLAEQLSNFYPDLNDPEVISSFVIYHQRFSTNTFPSWQLAQPLRSLAHNGEINTLSGNLRWLQSHESKFYDPELGPGIDDIKNIIPAGCSDSVALDCLFELLLRTRRELPEVKLMLLPAAWENNQRMAKKTRDYYAYSHCVLEPWDGPAAICAYSGDWVLGGLDRNGLRPLRYHLTRDNLLVLGSESGVVRTDPTEVIASGHVSPGGMLAVNLREGKLYDNVQLEDKVASQLPFGEWVKQIRTVNMPPEAKLSEAELAPEQLHRFLSTAGYSFEDLEHVLQPMVDESKEPTGSMGDDSPLAVLSDRFRPWHHFFRQNFAQVTNPAIDSLRERYVMSLTTRLGNLGNILEEEARQTNVLQLESPVYLRAGYNFLREQMQDDAAELATTIPVTQSLTTGLEQLTQRAEQAIRNGANHIFLSDRQISMQQKPIPMILAVGAVHSHLINQELRSSTSINVITAEAMDTHTFAVLISIGATTIYPWLAQECLLYRQRQGLFGKLGFPEVARRYLTAVETGLLKIMSKMGISVISSYRGGYNLEAIGLSRSLVADLFPGIASRISGIGLLGIDKKQTEQHRHAWDPHTRPLAVGGFLKARQSGEQHAWDGKVINILQQACRDGAFFRYQEYLAELAKLPRVNIRDLLEIKTNENQRISLEEVENITSLRKRMVAPGISLGALSPEAHECLSIAMNRIGAKSDSGEGGEDPARFRAQGNGDNASSAIKQVASGRFGVTTEYLNNASEIEIKIAQGAKPGEGGQLPGIKVSALIAKLRHSIPGITLISPPPHHDIYSIEDLAQLIYDLKQVNPQAQICVKLVARNGIGAIATGVTKAHADVILISGHSGGTGASPISSIKFAGLPWEMGLSEVHQVLTLNGLRNKIKLRVDGGIRTGRDIIIASLLGAEEFGIGTAALIAMGCLMVRQCHSNTCPVGVCTQHEHLRKHFVGKPEHVISLFTFIADDVRNWLAALGANALTDIIGHSEYLRQISTGAAELDALDLNPLLVKFDHKSLDFTRTKTRNSVAPSLDEQIIKDAQPLFQDREKMQLDYSIRNTHRAVGSRVASEITRSFGMRGLPEHHLCLTLRGTAGQSLGAFTVKGQRIEMIGEANDYVAKGLSGGTVIIRRPITAKISSNQHTILGNTALYGATSGLLLAAGRAAQRFAVRNSGATAVIEGCDDNGCEYMTGGFVLVLGSIGNNFAAGMTGGHAVIYQSSDDFYSVINTESVNIMPVTTEYWRNYIHELIELHHRNTHSSWAAALLSEWQQQASNFYHVIAKEILAQNLLSHPLAVAGKQIKPGMVGG